VSASLREFRRQLEALAGELEQALEAAGTPEEVEEARVRYLGRKGRISKVMGGLKDLPQEDRPQAGKTANEVKSRLQTLIDKRTETLRRRSSQVDLSRFDHTLPGRRPWVGSLHPVTIVLDEICAVFCEIGFEVVTGPEVENDFYNFEALNMPQDHPARDMQDTLYITESILLRTHTSPLQIRTMNHRMPPVAAIAPGKVFRRDADLTHSPMFHQIEGFLVDHQVSMADLRGTLTYFVQSLFHEQTRVRFRPSFFPFTEPSAEVDISCVICNGSGFLGEEPCRVCKQTGWVEILGCGMIDPAVFQAVGYDTDTFSGFAFGLGVERVAMLKYGIDDLRLFFDNDLRFLRQFEQLPAA